MKSAYDEVPECSECNEPDVDTAQEYRLEHYFSETDRAAVNQLAERYNGLIPPERIEAVRQNDSIFTSDRELFDSVYESETGDCPEPGSKVLGYTRGAAEGPRIATDYLEVPRTIYHERLHQFSAPGIEKEIGSRLDEGITEELAIDNLGAEPLDGPGQTYPEERAAAREIRELCGDEAVEKAYFQGDTQALRACLDRELGPQGLERLRERLGDPVE